MNPCRTVHFGYSHPSRRPSFPWGPSQHRPPGGSHLTSRSPLGIGSFDKSDKVRVDVVEVDWRGRLAALGGGRMGSLEEIGLFQRFGPIERWVVRWVSTSCASRIRAVLTG